MKKDQELCGCAGPGVPRGYGPLFELQRLVASLEKREKERKEAEEKERKAVLMSGQGE